MLISAGERTISAKVAKKARTYEWVIVTIIWKISRRPSSTSSYQGNMYILIATESARNPVKKGAKVWSGFAVTFSFRNVFFLHLFDHQSVRIDLAQASLRSREVWNGMALPWRRRRWRWITYQSPSRIDRRQPLSQACQVVLACAGPREMSSLWLKEKNEKLLKPRGTCPLYLGVFPNDSAQREYSWCSNINEKRRRVLFEIDQLTDLHAKEVMYHASSYRKYTSPKSLHSVAIIQRLSPMTATKHGLQMSYFNDRGVDHRCLLYYESMKPHCAIYMASYCEMKYRKKLSESTVWRAQVTWSKGTLTWDWSFTDLTSVQNRSMCSAVKYSARAN